MYEEYVQKKNYKYIYWNTSNVFYNIYLNNLILYLVDIE